MTKKKIIIAVTGASGAIYAKILFRKLEFLKEQIESAGVIFSKYAREVWKYELEDESYLNLSFPTYKEDDFFAPFASGSSGFETMIICPCSMGSMGRIASGISSDLITRSADVILKEKKKLILVPRETPYNLIHIRNMETITEAGGIICPASPSFYSKPDTIEKAVETVIDRVLGLAGFEISSFQWGEKD